MRIEGTSAFAHTANQISLVSTPLLMASWTVQPSSGRTVSRAQDDAYSGPKTAAMRPQNSLRRTSVERLGLLGGHVAANGREDVGQGDVEG